ncbi:MAG: transglutaminase-like cysteine peptidase [Azoarcus sp.]|jgi:predicted transglutaminase-like cysteine proteinase|nr:transglutaminase-like cysteine peptidase [Azoarcus sp.]
MAGSVEARTDFARMEQLAETQYGKAAADTIRAWRDMIEASRKLPDRAKLERTNDFVNRHVFYESDIVIWKQVDYWATPLELFGKQAGDCEDFAIAKYVTLRLLDIPVQKLRLVYARARLNGGDGKALQAHMVLSYYETPTSEPLVLDNLIPRIHRAKQRPDLFPVFSFNHEGLWMEGERTSSSSPTARLSRWRDVLQRMRQEGWDPNLATLSAQSILSWKRAKSRPSLASQKAGKGKYRSLARKAASSRLAKKAVKSRPVAKMAKSKVKKATKSRFSLRKARRR